MADAPAKSTVEKIAVTMADGREVAFNKKQKLVKTSEFGEDGSVSVRLDFVNGETRNFVIPTDMLNRFAAHGAEQKLGDAIAGETIIDDAILAVDDLLTRLGAEDATAARVAQLHLFGGLSVEEAAGAVGISRAVAYRNWKYARAWLRAALEK